MINYPHAIPHSLIQWVKLQLRITSTPTSYYLTESALHLQTPDTNYSDRLLLTMFTLYVSPNFDTTFATLNITPELQNSAVVVSYAHSSGVRGPSEGSGVLAVSFWLFVHS